MCIIWAPAPIRFSHNIWAMPLRVLFNTYPLAFACPGGGEVQLQSCREALQRRGIIVELFDPWHPQFDQADVVHFFSVQGGSIPFCDYVKRRGLPLVLSPILWLGEDKHDYALEEIGALLRLCDLALPNSVEEGRLLATYYGLEDAKFVPIVNGADVRFHLPADPRLFRETYGVNGEFLLCLANIEPRKNQLQLIRAVRDLTMDIRVYAYTFPRELAGAVLPVGRLLADAQEQDVLFYNYSILDEFLPRIVRLPCTKVLYYHNVTPGDFFREYEPDFATLLDNSRRQFSSFAHFQAVVANSHFSLDEIRKTLDANIFQGIHPPM